MNTEKINSLITRDDAKLGDAIKAVDAADAAKKVEACKAYHAAFDEHYKYVASVLAEEEANASKAEQECTDAESAAQKAEDEVKALEAELEELNKGPGEGSAAAGEKVKATAGAPLANFLKDRADLEARLTVTAALVAHTTADAKTAFELPEDEIQKLADEWENLSAAFEDDVTKVLADADALVKSQADIAGDTTAKEISDLWDKLKQDAAILQSASDDNKERKEASEESVKEFEFERKRLLLWCRQQKTNLDAMVEPDHIQEFCASLLNNYPAMEDNFGIIYERALPLLPNNETQSALLEVNEVWLNLQVCAYDRLRHTLLEIHHNSKLEDEVRAFSGYSQRCGAFLQEFTRLLATPTDSDSDRVVKPVSDQAQVLLRQFDAHKHLTDHMREFSLRMECFRDNYNSLRRAVLSRLTFLAVTPTLATSQRRKDEYVSRMGELRQWVDQKSQGESWADIHDRVLKIADLIEQEQSSLNQPGNTNSSSTDAPKEETDSTTQ